MSPIGGPLEESELDRLADFLDNCKSDRAMNIEVLDGFFAALIAGPELVPPSEYLPHVFGGPINETCDFASVEDFNEIFSLIMRHWNSIAATLADGEALLPILLEDEDGVARGNDWAHGFMHGVAMRVDPWTEIFQDEEQGPLIAPVVILHHENDPAMALPLAELAREKRDELLVYMAAGVTHAYRYFQKRRPFHAPAARKRASSKVGGAKVGRNDACPCGSGKKYKRCCGGATIH